MYHVFVVDMSINKEWELWQPKYRNGKGGSELDTMVGTLSLQGKCFSCNHGYCWVDMSVLIRECYELVRRGCIDKVGKNLYTVI